MAKLNFTIKSECRLDGKVAKPGDKMTVDTDVAEDVKKATDMHAAARLVEDASAAIKEVKDKEAADAAKAQAATDVADAKTQAKADAKDAKK